MQRATTRLGAAAATIAESLRWGRPETVVARVLTSLTEIPYLLTRLPSP
jgi:hypothetical protein